MTVALRIIERVDVPGVLDAAERTSWARMEWLIGPACATRLRRADGGERRTIGVPAVSIAVWLLENWWSLLYELAPSGLSGGAPSWQSLDSADDGWRFRHSLRTADSSLLLPDLRVYSTGPNLLWSLVPDPPQAAATHYLDAAEVTTSRDRGLAELGEFVVWTLAALRDVDCEVTSWLRDRSAALRDAVNSNDTAAFCRAAGRMGLDPFDTAAWPAGVQAWLTAAPAEMLDSAFTADLLGFARDIDDLPAVDATLRSIVKRFAMRRHGVPERLADGHDAVPNIDLPAYTVGYDRALRLRRTAGLAAEDAVSDFGRVVHEGAGVVLRSDAQPMVAPVASIGGWRGESPQVVTRRLTGKRQSGAQRFALARGLYLALWASAHGPRLASDARDRDQRAARAFAAELLAPRKVVMKRVDVLRRTMPLDDALAEVAAGYDVDVQVAAHQLANARGGR